MVSCEGYNIKLLFKGNLLYHTHLDADMEALTAYPFLKDFKGAQSRHLEFILNNEKITVKLKKT